MWRSDKRNEFGRNTVIWLLSTPACSEVNHSMQEFTGVMYASREQHMESRQGRQTKDNHDMKKLVQFLQARDLFSEEFILFSLAIGITADGSVNVDGTKRPLKLQKRPNKGYCRRYRPDNFSLLPCQY